MSTVTLEAPTIRYHDLLPQQSLGSGYSVPNEDVRIWRELVRGRRINRAGGICSGGEVGLFAILPTVREELVLVDHNYRSLQYAMVKYVLLREHGLAGCLRLMKEGNDVFRNACRKAADQLPRMNFKSYSYGNYSYENMNTAADGIADACSGRSAFLHGEESLSGMWEGMGLPTLRKAASKLDKVTFVHGDFVTIQEHGPFDLFYISNAHECGNGNLKNKLSEDIQTLIRPGGYVLSSTPLRKVTRAIVGYRGPRYENCPPDGWKLVKEIPRGKFGMSRWRYCLYQVGA